MFSEKKRRFLFRCDDCKTILEIELEKMEEIKRVNDNDLLLECVCGGICQVLRD